MYNLLEFKKKIPGRQTAKVQHPGQRRVEKISVEVNRGGRQPHLEEGLRKRKEAQSTSYRV